MIAYLLAGALHGLCDLDVTNAIGNSRVSMTSGKDLGQTDKGIVAEHHCHGCFSVSVPAPMMATAVIEAASVTLPQPHARGSGLTPSIGTPPPKFLI